jgi:hypothetical protein
MSKMTIRAPLLLAPNASAFPAPPAPTRTNNRPSRGEPEDVPPSLQPCYDNCSIGIAKSVIITPIVI